MKLAFLFIGIVLLAGLFTFGPLWFVEHRNKKIRAARESK